MGEGRRENLKREGKKQRKEEKEENKSKRQTPDHALE